MPHSPAQMRFEHLVIKHQRHSGAVILDAVRQGETVRVFAVGRVAPGEICTAAGEVRSLGNHAILTTLADTLLPGIKTSAPDHALFHDLNTAVAIRNGQPIETTLDWLSWHCKHHGLEAALIVDRSDPAKGSAFADGLKAAHVPGLKTLVVLQCDHPLGNPDLPDEAHPFCAPDAPGKDRMEIPPSAPWRAPFAQLNLIELLRHRFLAEARTVSLLDISDLLAPNQSEKLFEKTHTSDSGITVLRGNRVYPWRVRSGQFPHFSDHICQQFDTQHVITRWCLSPAKIPDTRLWRPFHVPGVSAATEVWPFMRCMALRHHADSVSKIVPKTSLVEVPQLIELAETLWKAKPVRVPKLKGKAQAKMKNSVAIVTCMKNEGPFILEWLAYHRVIGVKNFLVYTNDCTDGTDTFLDLLQQKGLVQHRDNPFRNTRLKPQHAALHAADNEPIMQMSDWQVCMDVDEFINIKVGDGRLSDLFGAVKDANMIAMTWRLFGNSDQHAFHDRPIIGDFTRCAAEMTRKPHQAWGFKTLYRNLGIFKKLGVHRPKGLNPQLWKEINWVNGSGKPMPKSNFRNAWRSTKDTVGYDLVSLNHYAVRSAESFLVKRDRGRVNHVDRDQGLAYWFRMNHNLEEDRSIQRMLPALEAEMKRLLADPEIAEKHARCVAAHRAKIEELKATSNYAAFYETLTGPRMERLSRQLSHFGANVFLAGPDVIPDEVAFGDHAKDFFFTVEKHETRH